MIDFTKIINDERKKNKYSFDEAIKNIDFGKLISTNDKHLMNEFNNFVNHLTNYKKLLIDYCETEEEIEFDIIHNGCDCGYTYVAGDVKFSDYAKEKWKDILYLPITKIEKYSNRYLKVYTDDENISYYDVRNFAASAAGYINSTEYDKCFSEGIYEKGPIFDAYDIELKYHISLDSDFLGSLYNEIKDLYDRNVSKEEFEKFIADQSDKF